MNKMGREVKYNNYEDSVYVNSVTDDVRFAECMKIYKTFHTLKDLNNALTKEAKKKISKTF